MSESATSDPGSADNQQPEERHDAVEATVDGTQPNGAPSESSPAEPSSPSDTPRGEFEEDVPAVEPSSATARPTRVPFDPGRSREYTRAGLAIGLTVLLAAVVLVIVCAAVFGRYPSMEAKELFGAVLPALVGLVGAATGFYYGGKDV